MTNGVIPQIPEHTRCGLWQIMRKVDVTFGQQIAERFKRFFVDCNERFVIKTCHTVDRHLIAFGFPDQIWFNPNNGITTANFAARDRFQHKAVFTCARQFHHDRHRRVQICRKAGINHLIFASIINCRKIGKFGSD